MYRVKNVCNRIRLVFNHNGGRLLMPNLSDIEAQEEVQFALNELTSHEYSDEEYMKWQEKLCKKAMKIDKTGKINFTPEAWFNWLVKEGLTNEDILNDLAREYGNWNGKEAVN